MRNISLGGTFAHFSCFMRVQSNLLRKLGSLSNKDGRLLRRRHLKSEFALLQTLSPLFHLVQVIKCWKNFSVVEV